MNLYLRGLISAAILWFYLNLQCASEIFSEFRLHGEVFQLRRLCAVSVRFVDDKPRCQHIVQFACYFFFGIVYIGAWKLSVDIKILGM